MDNLSLTVSVSDIEKCAYHTYCLDDGRIVFLMACIAERDMAQASADSLMQMARQDPARVSKTVSSDG